MRRFFGLPLTVGVIALALHIDYWDYLGWKDEFGRPGNTARQRAYAKAARSKTIFTPEMVVHGDERLKGHDAKSILKGIAHHRRQPAPATVSLEREGDVLEIHLAPIGAAVGPADVHVVQFIPSREVSIEAGENAGLEMTYTNIVTDWEKNRPEPANWAARMKKRAAWTLPCGSKPNRSISCDGPRHGASVFLAGILNVPPCPPSILGHSSTFTAAAKIMCRFIIRMK